MALSQKAKINCSLRVNEGSNSYSWGLFCSSPPEILLRIWLSNNRSLSGEKLKGTEKERDMRRGGKARVRVSDALMRG